MTWGREKMISYPIFTAYNWHCRMRGFLQVGLLPCLWFLCLSFASLNFVLEMPLFELCLLNLCILYFRNLLSFLKNKVPRSLYEWLIAVNKLLLTSNKIQFWKFQYVLSKLIVLWYYLSVRVKSCQIIIMYFPWAWIPHNFRLCII